MLSFGNAGGLLSPRFAIVSFILPLTFCSSSANLSSASSPLYSLFDCDFGCLFWHTKSFFWRLRWNQVHFLLFLGTSIVGFLWVMVGLSLTSASGFYVNTTWSRNSREFSKWTWQRQICSIGPDHPALVLDRPSVRRGCLDELIDETKLSARQLEQNTTWSKRPALPSDLLSFRSPRSSSPEVEYGDS